jgi:heme oxygenase (biliverdin-IX-beta and delta-forming)
MADRPEPQSNPAAAARRLMRACDRATLATTLKNEAGRWPYASLVLVASDLDASPLLLISTLAEHTKNLRRESRASLLFDGTAGLDDPLTGARATIVGEIAAVSDDHCRERFLNRHPSARAYAGFADFQLYRMAVARAHLVAGFGRIDWIEASDLICLPGAAAWLREAEAGILQHMNADHASSLDLYAQRLLGLDGTGWRITGVDAEGCDLRRAGAVARLDFPAPVADLLSVRQVFAALAQSARGDDRQG